MEATQEKQGVSRNDEAREAIAKQRALENGVPEKALNVEPETVVEDEQKADEPEVVDEKPVEVKPEEIIKFVGADGTEYLIPKSAKAKFKIDGKEVEDTVDSVHRSYQKGAAGDKRLQEAHERLKEADVKEGDLSRREAEFQRRMQVATTQKAEGTLSEDEFDKLSGELIESLMDADDARAKAVLRKVIPIRPQENVLSPEKVESVLERIEINKANRRFEKEYAELSKNREVRDRINAKTAELYKADPDRPKWDIIKDAAESVKQGLEDEDTNYFMTRLSNYHEQGLTIPDIIAGRTAPKKGVVKRKSAPTPIGGAAAIGQDEKVPSREEILAGMRRARNQAV